MSEMIERVARAMHVRKYGEWYEGPQSQTDSQRECLADALAAIEAMREPTEGMVEAAYRDVDAIGFVDGYGRHIENLPAAWQAMIDAALEEGK